MRFPAELRIVATDFADVVRIGESMQVDRQWPDVSVRGLDSHQRQTQCVYVQPGKVIFINHSRVIHVGPSLVYKLLSFSQRLQIHHVMFWHRLSSFLHIKKQGTCHQQLLQYSQPPLIIIPDILNLLDLLIWGWACLKTDLQDQRPVRTCLLSWSSTDRIFSCLQNTIFTCCITSGACVAQSICVCCVSRERFTSRRQGRRYLYTIGAGGNAKSGGLPWRKRWTYIPKFWVHDPKDCSQCSQVMIQTERSMDCSLMTSWPLLISSLSTGFIRRIRISPRFCTCLKNLHTNLWGFVVDDKVTRLQKSLAQELNLRNALNRGLNRALGSLPRIPNNLPVEVMNRLSFMILESQLSKEKIIGRQRRWSST